MNINEYNNFNLKSILNKNAVNKLLDKIEEDMDKNKNELVNVNSNLLSELSQLNPLVALSNLNSEIYKSDKEFMNRKNFMFPSFLKMGELHNWHSTPSQIIGDKEFHSKIPFLLPVASNGFGFFMNQKYKKEITSVIELAGVKMLASLPDGFSRVTIIDKNGSGQNFPTLLMLNEKFTDSKIISEDYTIELELLALKDSMKIIVQSITANGFSSIEEYNKETEEIVQPYRFMFISNFPSGFSKKAAEALVAIMESGASAGIYVFMTFTSDPKYGMNQQINGIPLSEFIKNINLFEYQSKPHDYTRRGLISHNVNLFSTPLIEDTEYKKLINNTFKIEFEVPDHKAVNNIIEDLNKRIQAMNLRPIINISKTLPDNFWTGNSGKGVSAPFAKSGIEDIYLSLGIDQNGEEVSTHHGIIGGATGSGKTVALHDMILHLCMKYSPKDLNFWLLDFKEGTEFAIYEHFPYMQILSMESEVEFGQEVLQKAIEVIKDRGILFKSLNQDISNLNAYNNAVEDKDKLPRIIIIIDEFQALFPKKAQVSSITNELIDKILRLGRSFGVNLLLSTQTLKGIDMDAQLMSNMPLRIALKMDEKDSIKLLGDNNSSARFLKNKNPGEGIYNKSYGDSVANVGFQAFFAEGESIYNIKESLVNHINKNYEQEAIDKLYFTRFVYNGDLIGKIEANEYINNIKTNNEKLSENKIYLGEPAGLNTEHSFFQFTNEFADNLIIVGMDLIKASSLFYYIVDQLYISENKPKIYFGNFNKTYKNDFNNLTKNMENVISFDNSNHKEIINELYEEYSLRSKLSEEELLKKEHIFNFNFFIENSKAFNDTSYGKDNPISKIKEIIYEGAELGIHIIIYATSFSTIMSVDLARDIEKFKKKIIFKGGNSLKVLGEDSGVSFSNSKYVAIGDTGIVGEKPFKFKPYINEELNKVIEND